MNVNRALRSDRLMKALTGMLPKEFLSLLKAFEQEMEKEKQARYLKEKKRDKCKRKPGGGRKGELKTIRDKLFFILLFFKCYPTFDLMGFMFNLNRSNACRNVHKLTLLLEKTLGKQMVLPKRKIRSLEELFELVPEVRDLLIDGTERPTRRPKDPDEQKDNYSGKKKRHTKKNTIIAGEDKEIRYLGPTVEGKKHDYGSFKDEFPTEPLGKPPPDDRRLWADLGYQGIEKDYPWLNVIQPKKKRKGGKLTDEEKAVNRLISSIRVKVEHAIGGVKRFGVVSDVFRNRKFGFDDKVMVISCGLWNYHLLSR